MRRMTMTMMMKMLMMMMIIVYYDECDWHEEIIFLNYSMHIDTQQAATKAGSGANNAPQREGGGSS